MADDTTNDDATGGGKNDDGSGKNDDDTQDDSKGLGEAGQRAIAAEREARRKAERDARDAKKELDKLRAEGQSDAEKALAKAKEEARGEALKEANVRVLKAEVRALAAGKMDPALAIKLLDLDQFEVDDDGEVDEKAISKAIDVLLKSHPGLANGKRTNGSADGGARDTATPVDMNSWLRGERVSP